MSDYLFIIEGTLHVDSDDADAVEEARDKISRAERWLQRRGFSTFGQESAGDEHRG